MIEHMRIFKYSVKSKSVGVGLTSGRLLSLILAPLLVASLIPILDSAFAAEAEQLINRRVEIWGLFYRLMAAAFVVGAAVQGVMAFVLFRFREKKEKPQEVVR